MTSCGLTLKILKHGPRTIEVQDGFSEPKLSEILTTLMEFSLLPGRINLSRRDSSFGLLQKTSSRYGQRPITVTDAIM